MSTQAELIAKKADPANFFAHVSTAYVEVLAGVRRPEQLARWLTDRVYYDLCNRARREAMARQVTGLNARPTVVLRHSKTFITDSNSYQGVVVLEIAGRARAVSVRAELIHSRYRITELNVIS